GRERFGYFCALSKVTRCKSETDTSHNQNTGYAPNLKNTPNQPDARQRYSAAKMHWGLPQF
ncbi:hypothetical protein, partial [Pseudomonas kitaguniensis]|uniref:hypothetical protein n=1 Tax=Pseudomonas kitaguniensis TaxID=2607908 RepID=UPI003D048C99